jgi:hypothetical protein
VKEWVSCTPSSMLGLEVDYVKSPAQVYREVAVATMSLFNNLDGFSYVYHGPHIRDNFSTWALCWDLDNTETTLLSSFIREPFKAGTSKKQPQPLFTGAEKGLAVEVHGFIVDTVSHLVRELDITSEFSVQTLVPPNQILRTYRGQSSIAGAAIPTLIASHDTKGRRVKASDPFCAIMRSSVQQA